jgi:hypothetical protein
MRYSSLFAGACALALAVPAGADEHGHHWGYAGEEGPTYWGRLNPEYAACMNGKAQSPVNIRTRNTRGASLSPIAFDSRRGSKIGDRGWHRVSLRYSPSRILGSKTDATRTTPIDVPLDRKVVEGNLWGLTFAALPLREGASFTIPNWQYDKGFGAFTVRVIGSATQATPAGAVPAWVIEAGTDPAQMTRYFIAKSRPTELGYRAGPMVQKLGGRCAGLG